MSVFSFQKYQEEIHKGIKSHNPFLKPHEFARRPPVPEDDDLNATVIEVMTDIGVLLDGSSVIDVFAVNSARRKRVEVSERKMTESDRSLFKKGKGVGTSIVA